MRNFDTFSRIPAGIALLLGVAALSVQPTTHAVNKSASPARAYYLTKTSVDGAHTLGACATGYHMASLWEIHEPAVLKYDTSLGLTTDDSGSGPPTGPVPGFGWIRTGFNDNAGGFPGSNCHTWSTADPSASGSAAGLTAEWQLNSGSYQTSPWLVGAGACNLALWVWCVQD
jgi:hypothetical protein